MAISQALGTTLTWDSEVVAALKTINGIEVTGNFEDSMTHDDTDGYAKPLPVTFVAGDITMEGFFEPTDTAGQVAMLTDMNAKSKKTWLITFPSATGGTWTGDGYMSAFKVGDADAEGLVPFTASIKVYGKPTFAVSAVTGMSAIGFSNDVLMMPTFAIGTLGPYVVTITAGQTSTVITPVDASDGEIITIYTDGGAAQVVATGEASSACTLDVDDTTVITVVISHATKASKTYTFNCAVLAA